MGRSSPVKIDPDDPQRHLVYAWEDGFRYFNERTLTRAQALRLIRRLARKWRVPMPHVAFMPKGKREWSYVQGEWLWVNYGQCNEGIIAHEMAHWTVERQYPEGTVEDHGWEFMDIYLDMLVYTQVAPRVALEASALAIGLEWLP